MMTRPALIAATAIGSLLASTPASAQRRGIGKTTSTKREVAADDDEEARPPRAKAAAKPGSKSAKPAATRKSRAAQLDEVADDDGPEARAVLPIKLRELIDVAVRLSPELARVKTDRRIALGTAGAAKKEQSWILGAEATYAINAVSRDVREVEPFKPVRQDEAKGMLSLGRKLPTGGFFGVELGMTRGASELAIPPEYYDALLAGQQQAGQDEVKEYFTTHRAIAKLQLTQPLARGFGPDVALAAERRASLELSAATIQTQLSAEELVFDIVTAYWELAYLAYAVDVRNEAVVLAETQEKVTQDEIHTGSQPKAALNAVAYELSTRREALLVAQLELEKKSLEVRRRVGLELGQRQIVLRPSEVFEIGRDEWDVDEVLALSRKANRRLLQLGIQRKIAEVDVKVAKNAMLPQLDLTLSGGIVGTGASQDAAFSGVGAVNGYEVMAGLKIEFELSGAARSARDAAVAKQARVEIDRADRARQLDADVVSAVKVVTAARARVGYADKAVYVAEENVKVEKQSFMAARSDNFRVMERQTQLIDARLRRGRAVVDYHTAVAQLQQLSGLILDQYEVDVRPGR